MLIYPQEMGGKGTKTAHEDEKGNQTIFPVQTGQCIYMQ